MAAKLPQQTKLNATKQFLVKYTPMFFIKMKISFYEWECLPLLWNAPRTSDAL